MVSKAVLFVVLAMAVTVNSMATGAASIEGGKPAKPNTKSCSKGKYGRLFKAKYSLCTGADAGVLEVHNVSLTAPYSRRAKRHALFRNKQVEICIAGKATGISEPIIALQNAMHGTAYLGPIPLPTAFCEISVDGCADISPLCGSAQSGVALVPGQEFCMCTNLQVPSIAPAGINVDTQFDVLGVDYSPVVDCERETSAQSLAKKNKQKLICIDIPAMIRNPPNGRR